MELASALSNRENRKKLTMLKAMKDGLLQNAPEQTPATSRPPARAGDLLKAICAVLVDSSEAMEVSAIREAAERRLQSPVNPGSVKACLSEGALSTPARFIRTKRGMYRLGPALS
jgi:hypothetical protein